jgi:hypothetical protein
MLLHLMTQQYLDAKVISKQANDIIMVERSLSIKG